MKAQITNNPVYWKRIEYTEAGTYTFTAPRTTTCKAIIVGAGGGGSSSHYYAWERGANGGQGAKVEGTIEITNGTSYTITVGDGGIGHRIVDGSGSNTGTDGGDSTAFGNTAGGGKGSGSHTGWYDYGYSWGGQGGEATVVDGFLGTTGATMSSDSVYLTYGGGGIGNSSMAGNGQGGYVMIEYISDSSDYTYKVDNLTAKIVKELLERKYYKYVTWTQPVLSADGTVGGNSFACRASDAYSGLPAYYAFDSNKTGTSWASNDTSGGSWIEFYNPVELRVSKLTITNYDWVIGNYTLQASNDGVGYKTILTGTNTVSTSGGTWSINISDTETYKYWRLVGDTYLSGSRAGAANIDITGYTVTDGTSSDYDFYVDTNTWKAFNI